MKSTQVLITMFLLLAILIIAAGCDDGNDSMMSGDNSTSSTSLIAAVYPTEGATDVSRSSSVSVKFSKPMDTLSVMDNFHLTGGEDMLLWMDSTIQYGGLGHMTMSNMNHMMNWMDSISITGTFQWNDLMDSCEFIPESDMMANQEYMILMCEGEMMNHGGMMGGGDHGDDEYHTYHFRTGP